MAKVPTTSHSLDLEAIAAQFRNGVEIKDRRYRFIKYRNCFVGSEAVDFLIYHGLASTRDAAVVLGQTIMNKIGSFEHVTRDHPFQDDYLFYHFVDRGGVATSHDTGEILSWGDYMHPTTTVSDDTTPLHEPDVTSQLDLNNVPPHDVDAGSFVWPLDDNNISLLDHVHPVGWRNPKPHSAYDLVVIGAGAAGLVTSSGAAGLGARVALIEANLLGGDCLNVGCVPSKTLIRAANLAHTVKNSDALADFGVSINGEIDIDFTKIMERIRRIRAQISHHDSAVRYTREMGVDVFIGRAEFVDKTSVVVNSEHIRFNKAVIATGGSPSLIPMQGIDGLFSRNKHPGDSPRPYVMTNETFFNMTKQPERLVVIGPGVIGIEMAQAMQRLGTKVNVMGRSGRILPREDADLCKVIQSQLEKEGVVFRLSVSTFESIGMTGEVLDNGLPEMLIKFRQEVDSKVADATICADAVLVAVGRLPNVCGMNLDAAGVEYDTRLGIKVNDLLQTTNPKIFAAGDCCSAFKFTHAADFMARTVIRNALFFGKGKVSDLLIPRATFTDPEIAAVGLCIEECDKKGIKYRTFEKKFADNDRSICDGETTGMVRIVVDTTSDRILGASIIGKGASNMISEITIAMQSNTGLGALASVIHPYPTSAEAVRQTGDLFNRTKLTPSIKSILRGLVKVQR